MRVFAGLLLLCVVGVTGCGRDSGPSHYTLEGTDVKFWSGDKPYPLDVAKVNRFEEMMNGMHFRTQVEHATADGRRITVSETLNTETGNFEVSHVGYSIVRNPQSPKPTITFQRDVPRKKP